MKPQRTKNRILLTEGETSRYRPPKIKTTSRSASIGEVPAGFPSFGAPAVALTSDRGRRPGGRILVVIRSERTRERITNVTRHFSHQSRTEIHVIDPVSADVAGEVRRAAVALNADWLCMVAHGGPGLMALFLDREDEKILRAAPCPVVCISEALRPNRKVELAGSFLRPIKRILVPVNSSADSQDLMARAVALAKPFGAKIDLLGVEELLRKSFDSARSTFRAARRARRLVVTDELAEVMGKFVPKRQRGRKIVSLGLPLFYATNRAARELQSDLIVLLAPNRRWDAHRRIDIGTERILRGAPCPVICIPERDFRADTAPQRVSMARFDNAEIPRAYVKPEARDEFSTVKTNNLYEHYESEITYSRR
jgi:nucleotide-binding universal stress UspA family protein